MKVEIDPENLLMLQIPVQMGHSDVRLRRGTLFISQRSLTGQVDEVDPVVAGSPGVGSSRSN